MTPQELMSAAQAAAENAVTPVIDFPVGAAILSADGRVFTGCNVQAPSIIQNYCAERVALLKALSEGAREFTHIAVATPKQPGTPPCGVCRQLLHEFAPGIEVILDQGGQATSVPLDELFPQGFHVEQEG
jgi:cytidine deaminase